MRADEGVGPGLTQGPHIFGRDAAIHLKMRLRALLIQEMTRLAHTSHGLRQELLVREPGVHAHDQYQVSQMQHCLQAADRSARIKCNASHTPKRLDMLQRSI